MASSKPIRRTPTAEADLIDIWAAVALHNEAAADRVIDGILLSIARLERFPLLGQSRDDALAGLRTLTVAPYVVAFYVTEEAVEILRVIHGARDFSVIDFVPTDPHRR